MILFLFFLLADSLPVRLSPAKPTVGDVIRVEVPGSTIASASGELEIVKREGPAIYVRSFRPGRRTLLVSLAEQPSKRFTLEVEIHSVLAPDDPLQPAPLVPPNLLPRDRRADIAVASAAAAALVSWALVFLLRGRERAAVVTPARGADEIFLETVSLLARRSDREAAIALADATREYLAAIDARWSVELTSAELLAQLRGHRHADLVRRILWNGDYAKFAQWPAGHDPTLTQQSLELLSLARPSEEVA